MEYEKAGDPTGAGLNWSHRTPGKIADELRSLNINVSGETVGNLLKKMGYSLQSNSKKISSGGKKLTKLEKEERDLQFKYIAKKEKSLKKVETRLLASTLNLKRL